MDGGGGDQVTDRPRSSREQHEPGEKGKRSYGILTHGTPTGRGSSAERASTRPPLRSAMMESDAVSGVRPLGEQGRSVTARIGRLFGFSLPLNRFRQFRILPGELAGRGNTALCQCSDIVGAPYMWAGDIPSAGEGTCLLQLQSSPQPTSNSRWVPCPFLPKIQQISTKTT